jgi:hypothetical protein
MSSYLSLFRSAQSTTGFSLLAFTSGFAGKATVPTYIAVLYIKLGGFWSLVDAVANRKFSTGD